MDVTNFQLSPVVGETEVIADPRRQPQQDEGDGDKRQRQEEALDEALKNTFPASDPFQSNSRRRPRPIAPGSHRVPLSPRFRSLAAFGRRPWCVRRGPRDRHPKPVTFADYRTATNSTIIR